MEFKQISIENFLSYYIKSTFDFQSTTIILGQNNTGKSKLFDAINFVLYERVYDTQKEEWILDRSQISKLILNKYARKKGIEETLPELQSAVQLIVEDGAELITIRRYYTYSYNENDYIMSESDSNLEINTRDLLNIEKPHFYQKHEAVDYLSKKFSSSIKDYFLFQGESASKILKLQANSAFMNAVKEIARLRIFEEATNIAYKFSEYVQTKITKKNNKSKKLENDISDLESKKSRIESKIDDYTKKREHSLKLSHEAEEKKNVIEEELQKYKEFEKYFADKKELEHRQEQLKKESKTVDSFKAIISEDAVFYKVKDKIASFKDFYRQLESKGEVPPSIPRSEIKKALDNHRCPICNADLSEGTPGREFAQKNLPKCDTDKLGENLLKLYHNAEIYTHEIETIPQRLKETLEQQRQFDQNKVNIARQLKEIEQQLDTINLSGQTNENKIKDLENKKRELRAIGQQYNNEYEEYIRADENLTNAKQELQEIRKQLNEKLHQEVDNVKDEDKIALTISEKLCIAMDKIKSVVNHLTYKQIEDRANEYYREMTKNNPALSGDIKVDIKKSDIYTVDEDGNRIQNINQANRISIQLAIIAGILTIASEQFSVQYPFVTDAPVSNLGGDNKLNTIKTIINAFEQSIIILKDDAESTSEDDDAIRELIKSSPDVGTAYELKISKADNITEQYTTVEKIK